MVGHAADKGILCGTFPNTDLALLQVPNLVLDGHQQLLERIVRLWNDGGGRHSIRLRFGSVSIVVAARQIRLAAIRCRCRAAVALAIGGCDSGSSYNCCSWDYRTAQRNDGGALLLAGAVVVGVAGCGGDGGGNCSGNSSGICSRRHGAPLDSSWLALNDV